ncbi:MAG: hypothetical protein PF484_09715 [Bacteroidales bacterium]|jgi:arsenate reductase|nr:hypothetical protein [Bacteroidales bacterium]
MKKVYTLSNCDTSRKILKQSNVANLGFEIKDIKVSPITEDELNQMQDLAGSYEAIFSRRSQKYKNLIINDMGLHEDDYKSLILQEYTFLKRPVIIDGNKIFIGNSKKNVDALLKHLEIT